MQYNQVNFGQNMLKEEKKLASLINKEFYLQLFLGFSHFSVQQRIIP